ncbi:hypothetical protein LFT48_07060 [Arthrobacter sp. FW305-123]|nr:hypothetical protein LFT48_07060 [Arthrobacter sp. FW305-123]
MSEEPGAASPEPPPPPELSPSIRAQLLATEHWSLLASRSTTQGEVLTRISMFLTFTSASLLSVALVGNATQFSDAFRAFALTIFSIDVVVGLLTQIRVLNVGMEDLMYVVAMNRLRAAYVDLDPGIAKYFMASYYDDMAGVSHTYYFLGPRSSLIQLAGSSMIFMVTANSALLALWTGSVLLALGLPMVAFVSAAVVVALAFSMVSMLVGKRAFDQAFKNNPPISPTPV